jgi:hypothetical protein
MHHTLWQLLQLQTHTIVLANAAHALCTVNMPYVKLSCMHACMTKCRPHANVACDYSSWTCFETEL